MSGIFNPAIFNNSIFNTGEAGVSVKTGTGGIDPVHIYKPTGLLERKLRKDVESRVVESRDIQREVFDEVIRPRLEQSLDFKPIQEMTSVEIDYEIGLLMREKLRKDEEDDMILLMMMIAND